MNKTILIGNNNNFSLKTNRWIFGILGLIYLTLGGFKFYSSGISIASVGWFTAGGCIFVYGLMAFSKSSQFALRINITEEVIEIKDKYFKSSTVLNWMDILSIEFDKYEISFVQKSKTKTFSYESNPDVSIEIKSIIREIAEKKGVAIKGG